MSSYRDIKQAIYRRKFDGILNDRQFATLWYGNKRKFANRRFNRSISRRARAIRSRGRGRYRAAASARAKAFVYRAKYRRLVGGLRRKARFFRNRVSGGTTSAAPIGYQ